MGMPVFALSAPYHGGVRGDCKLKIARVFPQSYSSLQAVHTSKIKDPAHLQVFGILSILLISSIIHETYSISVSMECTKAPSADTPMGLYTTSCKLCSDLLICKIPVLHCKPKFQLEDQN